MHIGYCRVSTGKQAASIEAQEAQFKKAGCEIVYKDENESGGKRNRPQLNKTLEHIRKGDVLVVCKLDRLSRSMIDLLTILKQIDEAGAAFRSLGEAIETQSAAGRMMMQMLGCFAQFEREIIVERINRGLAHARANGKIGGGRYKLSPADQREPFRGSLRVNFCRRAACTPNLSNIIVPFGKYRGLPVENLLADEGNYLQWMFSEPTLIARLRKRHPRFFAMVSEAYAARQLQTQPVAVQRTPRKRTIAPLSRLKQFTNHIKNLYGRYSPQDVTTLSPADLKKYRNDMDIVRKIRAVLESLRADLSEPEEEAAWERVLHLAGWQDKTSEELDVALGVRPVQPAGPRTGTLNLAALKARAKKPGAATVPGKVPAKPNP